MTPSRSSSGSGSSSDAADVSGVLWVVRTATLLQPLASICWSHVASEQGTRVFVPANLRNEVQT
jgi:hypothetical protein